MVRIDVIEDGDNSQPNVILYAEECKWELDYVKQQLFPHVLDRYEFLVLKTVDLIQYRKPHVNVIVIFSSNVMTMHEIQEVVQFHQPIIVVHMSDEWGSKPEYVALSQSVPLVLRQHWFPNAYRHQKNVFQILLGYYTGFPIDLPFVPVSQRAYTWSFIGTVNEERRQMLSVLTQRWANKTSYFRGGGVKVYDMAVTYSNAIFVPNGRGANRLDCFRIYEAMMAGAIPIVVGPKQELEETFVFEGQQDQWPWVTAQTWHDAIDQCNVLLNDPTLLRAKQQFVIAWLHDHFEIARERITKALVLHEGHKR